MGGSFSVKYLIYFLKVLGSGKILSKFWLRICCSSKSIIVLMSSSSRLSGSMSLMLFFRRKFFGVWGC
jgi:hypothetical protein